MKKIAAIIVSFIIVLVLPSSFAQTPNQIQVTAPWLEDKNTIQVSIVNEAGLAQDKISIIKKAIESEDRIGVNGHTYFVGWAGALVSLNETKIKKFNITVDSKYVKKDITIELLDEKNAEHNGFTKLHYGDNRIVSVSIEIFDAKNIPPAGLETLVRHEFGHALGLGHATDANSIMYLTIGYSPKLISSCELDAIKSLAERSTFTNVNCLST